VDASLTGDMSNEPLDRLARAAVCRNSFPGSKSATVSLSLAIGRSSEVQMHQCGSDAVEVSHEQLSGRECKTPLVDERFLAGGGWLEGVPQENAPLAASP